MKRVVATPTPLACASTNPLERQQGSPHGSNSQDKTSQIPSNKKYVRGLNTICAAGILLLIPLHGYPQKCQVKPGNGTVCLSPGTTCGEVSGQHGTCRQLSDECECHLLVEAVYTVSVAVSGLNGGAIIFQDNGGDSLRVSTIGSFAFSKPIPDGKPYDVTIQAQPGGQTCTLGSHSSGTANGVVVVPVSCRNITGAPQVEVYVSYAENELLPQALTRYLSGIRLLLHPPGLCRRGIQAESWSATSARRTSCLGRNRKWTASQIPRHRIRCGTLPLRTPPTGFSDRSASLPREYTFLRGIN
jgi:hypothetical protein